MANHLIPIDMRNATRSTDEQGSGIGGPGDPSPTLTSPPAGVPAIAVHITQNPIVGHDFTPQLSCGSPTGQATIGVAYPVAMRGRPGGAEFELGEPDVYNSLRAGDGGSSRQNAVLTPELTVRRLTPVECERLMGWPDDHTLYADDGTEIADSHRYRFCGNGVVSSVAEWIGHRLAKAAS